MSFDRKSEGGGDRRGRVLLIGGVPDDYSGSEVYCSPARPYEKKLVEAVGEGYEVLMNRYWGFEDEKVGAIQDDTFVTSIGKASRKLDFLKIDVSMDYYEILGLGHLRHDASSEDIRSAYRGIALRYHPDRRSDGDDAIFKIINTAYETLSDSRKRMEYESSLPFDDSIPDQSQINSPEDFYRIFSKAFHLNGKWSKVKPVPKFGDESTPIEQVNEFYNFWLTFDSCREFSYLNEYDVSKAENREERRWMERINNKKQAQKRKSEHLRILSLVKMSMNLDPRLKAEKEKIRLEKERKKLEKKKRLESKQYSVDSWPQKQPSSMMKVEELKKKVIELCASNGLEIDDLGSMVEAASREQLSEIVDSFRDVEVAKKLIQKIVSSMKKNVSEEKKSDGMDTDGGGDGEEWTASEIAKLFRALNIFPAGFPNRWKKISAYLGDRKSEDQILRRVKLWANRKQDVGRSKDGENARQTVQDGHEAKEGSTDFRNWSATSQRALELALKKYSASTPNRWDEISKEVSEKTKRECIERYKYLVDITRARRANGTQ